MKERVLIIYDALMSINATAKVLGVSGKTVMKVLVSNGVYPTEQAELANRLAKTLTVEEIANRLTITPKTVRAYLPYTKGTYLTSDKSPNARRIASCRARKTKNSSHAEKFEI